MLIKKRFMASILLGICVLAGFLGSTVNKEAFVVQAEASIKSDTFIYNGTNTSNYNGESVFVITDNANTSFASDDAYSFQKEMNLIEVKLKNVKTVVIDDNATELYYFMLKYYPEATTLHIGKKVKTIHMKNDYINFDYGVNSMKSLTTINVENETVRDKIVELTDIFTEITNIIQQTKYNIKSRE